MAPNKHPWKECFISTAVSPLPKKKTDTPLDSYQGWRLDIKIPVFPEILKLLKSDIF
jgi:hypothetical protein